MWRLLKETFNEWNRDNAFELGAAIAYYTAVSLAPLLVIAVAIGGAVFGQEAARGEIVNQFSSLMGENGAHAIQSILEHAGQQQKHGLVAGGLGIIILLIGAAGVFVQLQTAMNTIWQVKPKLDSALKETLRKYLLSFTMVIGLGFLLLVSLIMSSAISAMGHYLGGLLTSNLTIAQLLNQVLSLGIIAVVLAVMFRFVPDVHLRWRDVWVGAALTSVLFTIGKFVIGFYLGHSTISSAYGAAGSFVAVLVWVYYSAAIMLFGVEFTKCDKRRRGNKIVPESHAERTSDAPDRNQRPDLRRAA